MEEVFGGESTWAKEVEREQPVPPAAPTQVLIRAMIYSSFSNCTWIGSCNNEITQGVVASYGAEDIRLLTPGEKRARERLSLIEKAKVLKKRLKKERGKGNMAKAADLAQQVGPLREKIRELGEEKQSHPHSHPFTQNILLNSIISPY